jgi:predicted RND superfamily exporter protein
MNLDFDLTTDNILIKVNELAENHLQQRGDMELLIDTAVKQDKIQLLEDLSFHAKFSNGLLRVIQKKDSTIDEEYFLKAVDEYKNSIEKVRTVLEELLSNASEFIKSVLTEKYLQLTQSSLANLNSLCSDLSYLKLFFNDLKNLNS